MRKVRDAIHLEADVVGLEGPDYEGAGRVRVADSVFRNWTPSRWAKRMKMDKRLTLKNGRITVGSPGIYFVYAQVYIYIWQQSRKPIQLISDKLSGRPRRECFPNYCE